MQKQIPLTIKLALIIRKMLFLTVGAFVAALAIEVFLAPNNIIDGGVVGISMILSYKLKLNLGLLVALINIPFITGDKDKDAAVVAATKAAGFDNLKGHKSVGGLRASIYNAMPKEGVEALVEFLKQYEAENA